MNETFYHVKWNVDEIYPSFRTIQFTVTDSLCYIGGLLGLFAGISILSLVELVYFFTLRLIGDAFKNQSS
jgi:Amiloride-sensitive sodium channel